MKQRLYILCVVLVCITQNVVAQIRVTGVVQDEITLQKIKNARIYLPELKKQVQTDTTGSFFLQAIQEGNYLIEISAPSYTNLVQRVRVISDTTFVFFINLSVTEMEEVFVARTH